MADADLDVGVLHDAGTVVERAAFREGSADGVVGREAMPFTHVMGEVDDGAVEVALYEIEVTGDPSTHVVFHGLHPVSIEAGLARNPGIVATAVHCVNAVPYVCAAKPGVRTYLDLPLVAGRAAPHLITPTVKDQP